MKTTNALPEGRGQQEHPQPGWDGDSCRDKLLGETFTQACNLLDTRVLTSSHFNNSHH